MKSSKLSNFAIPLAFIAGIFTYFLSLSPVIVLSSITSQLFLQFLRLLSLPLIFFALTSTLSNMKNLGEMKLLGKKTLIYTLSTTLIAATIALTIFLLLTPSAIPLETATNSSHDIVSNSSYLTFFLQIIPDNFIKAFLDNNVIGIAFMAVLLGIGTLSLPENQKAPIALFFENAFNLLLKITSWITWIMPIGIWAFTTQFFLEMESNQERMGQLFIYAVCVVGANLIQGFITLPIFLKAKGLKPLLVFNAMSPALLTAFLTKSSSATLPQALDCAQNRLGISPKTAKFTLPMCSIINMNACAGFILITVLFVATSHGVVFSMSEYLFWIVMATLAAVGNAGVPMGCYFLASAFLLNMNIPLEMMGFILPLYAFFDMIETAVNVWSDSCITAMVEKDLLTKPSAIAETA